MKQPIRYDRKQESGIRHILKKIFAIREIVILLLVLVLGVFMALNSRQFLTTANFKTIGNYMANDMIIGAFLTISLIAGNTDFSVGSNMGCSAFVCGLLLNAGLPVWVCILVGLCVGVAIGALNAFCIVQLKVVPMIATMGTWMAFKGAGLMIINSSTLSNFPASFKAIVQDWNLFGVSTLIVVMLWLYICMYIVMIGAAINSYYEGKFREFEERARRRRFVRREAAKEPEEQVSP